MLSAVATDSLVSLVNKFGFFMHLNFVNELLYQYGVYAVFILVMLEGDITLLLAGVLATFLGYRATIGIAAAVFAVAALIVALSPLRTARHEDAGAI